MTQTVTPNQAKLWLSSGEAALIDVREPDEFKSEHIACAASMPLGDLADLIAKMDIPADRKLIFQCQKGKRGESACSVAANLRKPVFNLEGGIDAWKNAGLPVVTSKAAKISLFRQVQMAVGSLIFLCVLLGFSGHAAGFYAAGIFGGALAVSGLTGWCGMAMLLGKMPWNKS